MTKGQLIVNHIKNKRRIYLLDLKLLTVQEVEHSETQHIHPFTGWKITKSTFTPTDEKETITMKEA